MDGEGEENANSENADLQTRPLRIREYPAGAAGPYVVYFRKISLPLKVLLISAELHSRFTSIKEVKKINEFKVRVILAKREEANEVVKMKRFEGVYRVYIPCEDVEIDGVVYDEFLTEKEVMELGDGRFRNMAFPSVPVLDCERLTMLSSDKSTRVSSNALRVTFAGTMIPDFLCVSKVLIPVRIYTPKVMLCVRCNRFGHTEKYCVNKEKCLKCGEDHVTSKCTKNSNTCILCNGSHDSLTTCKAYQEAKKKVKNKLVARSKASCADLLKIVNAPIQTSNRFTPLENQSASPDENDLEGISHCSYNPPRKRKTNTVGGSNISKSVVDSPKKSSSSKEHFPPLRPTEDIPGFQKVETSEETEDSLSEILKSLCGLFGVNPTWCKLVESVAPVLSKLWDTLKSLLPLLSPLLEFFRSKNGQK